MKERPLNSKIPVHTLKNTGEDTTLLVNSNLPLITGV